MNLETYSDILKSLVHQISICCVKNTPYYHLTTEIIQMIESYLDDSVFFYKNKDIVNYYASLAYAHGWICTGSYLGLYSIPFFPISWRNIEFPKEYDKTHLNEKTERYLSMLSCAIPSVSNCLMIGSPLSKASDHCLYIAKLNLEKGEFLYKQDSNIPALGYLCYGYGWLDTAVRSGLLHVIQRPDLFTTEC